MRLALALLAPFVAGTLFAQQSAQVPPTGSPSDQGPSTNPVTTLASEFLEHDFFNVFLFANAVYDSIPATIGSEGVNQGGWGFDGGGGVDAFKQFRDGFVSLGYRGDYRDYSSRFFPSGTDQNLSFAYAKRLGPRWSFNANVNGGIFLYGGTYFGAVPSEVNYVQTNPFSSESKFLSTGVSLAYRQTRRLSYIFTGQGYLNRYNIPGSIGSTGVTGAASVLYRLTARTNVGATYSHSYFTYQRSAGEADADTVVGTVSHTFTRHWFASVSGGATRTDSHGTISVPVLIVNGNNLLPGYEIGHYNRTATFPSVVGSVTRQLRRTSLSLSGGQNIAAGNGVFLSSKDLFLFGYYSYSVRRWNLSFGGGVTRLSSVANAVSYSYTSSSFTASYAYNVARHLGTNVRYEFIKYGTIGSVGSVTDNRILFGVYFSSKTVPLTLF